MDYNEKYLKRKTFITDSTRKILEKLKKMANRIFYWIGFVVWLLEPDVETKDARRSFWLDKIHGRYNTGSHLKINKRYKVVASHVQSVKTGESYNYFMKNMYTIRPVPLEVVIVTECGCKITDGRKWTGWQTACVVYLYR